MDKSEGHEAELGEGGLGTKHWGLPVYLGQ